MSLGLNALLKAASTVPKGLKFPEGASRLSLNALRFIHKWESEGKNENSVGDLRFHPNNLENTPVPGLEPNTEKLIECKNLTDSLDSTLRDLDDFNPLKEATKNFKDLSFYQPGNEDAIPEVDWDFYRKWIKDPDVVDILKEYHDGIISEATKYYKKDILPKVFYEMEEFQNDVFLWFYSKASEAEHHIGLVFDELEATVEYIDDLRTMTSAELMEREPRIAAAVQEEWDNDRWFGVTNDHPDN
eukprot:TRINITY_DN317_c0_g1_i3.p1 TRINITY_DN317_c0_g1~~TRINITY_DN317_c0_g1_i3.p1  ORF type:complete len:244 (+),score=63.46 TRINITY_DN317_c0_g1_i3:11-742(+)